MKFRTRWLATTPNLDRLASRGLRFTQFSLLPAVAAPTAALSPQSHTR